MTFGKSMTGLLIAVAVMSAMVLAKVNWHGRWEIVAWEATRLPA